MVIIDFETNGSTIGDVVEVAVLKVELNAYGKYEVVDTFHRYYHSAYPVNQHTLAVHKLSPRIIEEFRNKSEECTPRHFVDDYEFDTFCMEAQNIVAHNLQFELRHIADRSSFSGHLCTMRDNMNIVRAVSEKTGKIKFPKLNETCAFYNIPFDSNSYHSAIFDVTMTLHILNAMPQDILDRIVIK